MHYCPLFRPHLQLDRYRTITQLTQQPLSHQTDETLIIYYTEYLPHACTYKHTYRFLRFGFHNRFSTFPFSITLTCYLRVDLHVHRCSSNPHEKFYVKITNSWRKTGLAFYLHKNKKPQWRHTVALLEKAFEHHNRCPNYHHVNMLFAIVRNTTHVNMQWMGYCMLEGMHNRGEHLL